MKDQREKNPLAVGLAQARWADRGPLTCAVCGKNFEGPTSRAGPRYCSNACRQRGWRNRHHPATV